MVKLCICQICNCGRHRCPHHPNGKASKQDPSCYFSEYGTQYHPHQISRTEPVKPKQEIHASTGVIDDRTTNRVDYVPHQVEARWQRQAAEYKAPDGTMDGLTSYNRDYTEKKGDPAKSVKREDTRKVSGKFFEGDPTYRDDYRQWEIPARHTYKPDAAWEKPENPFGGQTTYDSDFQKYKSGRTEPIKPSSQVHASGEPFDDRTGYRDAYIKHPMPARYVKEKEKFSPNMVPFAGTTNYQSDFIPREGTITKMIKPNATTYASTAPFESSTTHKSDFKEYEVRLPEFKTREGYVAPQGTMDMQTSHKLDYTPKPIEMVAACKPVQNTKRVEAAFNGSTTYDNDFRQWESARHLPEIRSTYRPPSAPFEGMPTYKSHYVKHDAVPVKPIRPDASIHATNAPFDDATNYKREFTPKILQPCPAALLDTGRTAYRFVEQTSEHKYYQQYQGPPENIQVA